MAGGGRVRAALIFVKTLCVFLLVFAGAVVVAGGALQLSPVTVQVTKEWCLFGFCIGLSMLAWAGAWLIAKN